MVLLSFLFHSKGRFCRPLIPFYARELPPLPKKKARSGNIRKKLVKDVEKELQQAEQYQLYKKAMNYDMPTIVQEQDKKK